MVVWMDTQIAHMLVFELVTIFTVVVLGRKDTDRQIAVCGLSEKNFFSRPPLSIPRPTLQGRCPSQLFGTTLSSTSGMLVSVYQPALGGGGPGGFQ